MRLVANYLRVKPLPPHPWTVPGVQGTLDATILETSPAVAAIKDSNQQPLYAIGKTVVIREPTKIIWVDGAAGEAIVDQLELLGIR